MPCYSWGTRVDVHGHATRTRGPKRSKTKAKAARTARKKSRR